MADDSSYTSEHVVAPALLDEVISLDAENQNDELDSVVRSQVSTLKKEAVFMTDVLLGT